MIKQLKELAYKRLRNKHPLVPEYAVPVPKYSDKTANGLTKCIVDWIIFNGGQAERISNMGRYIDERKVVTDTIGYQRTIGSGKYIPGNGTKGTADISSTINGISVKIEIKIGNDRQRKAQKKYQADIERAGGIYFIARNFDEFITFYNKIITHKITLF